LRVAGFHRPVVIKSERQQHGFFQPLIHLPLAIALLGDAGLAGVEHRQGLLDRAAQFGGRILGIEFRPTLEGGVDDVS
jgi:hypothetical protein